MRITTLIENTRTGDKDGLIAEHGLSLHISFNRKTILFDTGGSDSFSRNADKLGVDLSTVHAAVLSHHHYDHGGGLPQFFALNSNVKVYLKKPPDGDCYFKARLFPQRHIGLDRNLFKNSSSRFIFIEEFSEILPGVFLFTDIGSTYPKPKGNRYLYLKKENRWSLDAFAHELTMAIREDDKLIIFTGCSHNGVLNMIDTVTKNFNGIPIKAIIGGFHLKDLPKRNTMEDSKSKIQNIARKMLDYQVQFIYTGHCTGQKAYAVLKNVLGEKLQHLHTGTIIEI